MFSFPPPGQPAGRFFGSRKRPRGRPKKFRLKILPKKRHPARTRQRRRMICRRKHPPKSGFRGRFLLQKLPVIRRKKRIIHTNKHLQTRVSRRADQFSPHAVHRCVHAGRTGKNKILQIGFGVVCSHQKGWEKSGRTPEKGKSKEENKKGPARGPFQTAGKIYQCIKNGGINNSIESTASTICSGMFHRAHFSHGMPAIPMAAIVTGAVGMMAFVQPSPNW